MVYYCVYQTRRLQSVLESKLKKSKRLKVARDKNITLNIIQTRRF